MNNKRKRAFLDDVDDRIKKIPRTHNISIEISFNADTKERKSHALYERTQNQHDPCMSTITVSDDDSSVEDSRSSMEDHNNVILNDEPVTVQKLSAYCLGERTQNQHNACMSTITVSDDDSSVEYTRVYRTQNQHNACMSTITVSDDDSSVEDSRSSMEDHNNVITNDEPVTVQELSAYCLGERTQNQHNACMSTNTVSDDDSCVEYICVDARAYFMEGSATHNNLENPYCSQLENQVFDDESSSSESDVPTEKTVLQKCKLENKVFDDENSSLKSDVPTEKTVLKKCKLENQVFDDESSSSENSSAEALETYDYVEHQVPVQNFSRDKSVTKVMAWNCDPTSSVSYDWNMMNTKLPK